MSSSLPTEDQWVPVSGRYFWTRIVASSIAYVLAAVVLAVVQIAMPLPTWVWSCQGALFALYLVELLLTRARVRRIHYFEAADDLMIRHGYLFRTMTVVPYGRMQYVDVSAGPVDQMLGLATLELHTASASSDAIIPGLPSAAADSLRARLTERGESRLAGL